VRHLLDGVGLSVCVVVHRIDAPLIARAVVFEMKDPIHHWIAQVQIGRRHIDLRTQRSRAVGKLSFFHALPLIWRIRTVCSSGVMSCQRFVSLLMRSPSLPRVRIPPRTARVAEFAIRRPIAQRRYCIRKILIVAEVLQPSRGAAAVVGCGMLAAGGERPACARRSWRRSRSATVVRSRSRLS
jgi:hypothetical protein